MITFTIAVLIGLVPMIPAVIFFTRNRKDAPEKATRNLLMGLNGFNVIIGLMALGIGLVWLATPSPAMANSLLQATATKDPYASLAAAISTGMATIGAGISVSATGAAAVGTIAEKPESFGRSLIFVGLAEGIAIYGLIISFMILNR